MNVVMMCFKHALIIALLFSMGVCLVSSPIHLLDCKGSPLGHLYSNPTPSVFYRIAASIPTARPMMKVLVYEVSIYLPPCLFLRGVQCLAHRTVSAFVCEGKHMVCLQASSVPS